MQNKTLTNEELSNYSFLEEMYEDSFFPDFLVDKCKAVLIQLCEQIESQDPSNDREMLALTHAATEKINELALEFDENKSELESTAREALSADFDAIVKAYGFDLDIEDVTAPRDW